MKLEDVKEGIKETASLIEESVFNDMVQMVTSNEDLEKLVTAYIEGLPKSEKHLAYTEGNFNERVSYIVGMTDEIVEKLRELDCVDKIREMQEAWSDSGFTFNGEHYYSPLTLLVVSLDSQRILPYNVKEWYKQNKEAFLKSLDKLILRKKCKVTAEESKGNLADNVRFFKKKYLPNNCSMSLAYFLQRAGARDVYSDNADSAYRKYADYISNKFEGIILKSNPNLKRFTYKSMVKDYFGLDLVEGKNAPKLAKQLKKSGISYTDEEVRHFGEVQRWWNDWYNEDFASTVTDNDVRCKDLWIDLKDFTIPYLVDKWAFNGSCNQSNSSAGADTHLILKHLGFEYLKGYSTYYRNGNYILQPSLRTYFLREGDDIGHAGSYADFSGTRAKACYEFTTILLCIMFGKKVEDFSSIDGMNIDCEQYYQSDTNSYFCFWANQGNNEYSKFGTKEDIFYNISVDDIQDYLDNEVPIRHLFYNMDSETKQRIKLAEGLSVKTMLKEKVSLNGYGLLGKIMKEYSI